MAISLSTSLRAPEENLSDRIELGEIRFDVDLKVEVLDLLDDPSSKVSPENRGWQLVAAEVSVSAL